MPGPVPGVRIIVCIAIVLLAGCTDTTAPPPAIETSGPDAAPTTNITIGTSVDVADSVSGTFQPTDHGTAQTAIAATGQAPSNAQSHDISDLFPVGTPVWVELNVARGDVVVGLGVSDFKAMWTSDCGGCAGGVGDVWSGAIVRTDETITINVLYIGQSTQPVEYTIDYTLRAEPSVIPTGIVLGVYMEPGMTVTFVGDQVPDVMVFAPDDTFVDLLDGGKTVYMALEPDGEIGEYAFLPIGHGGFFSLQVTGERADARLLIQEIQTTGPHAVDQNVEMHFDLERQPLQMGVLYFGRASQDASVRLTSPDGITVETGYPGLATNVGGFQQTPMGDARLTAGTYTLAWEDTLNDGSIQVQEFFTLYSR